MRGFAYAIAAIAAVGIMIAIATKPGEQAADNQAAEEPQEVAASSVTESVDETTVEAVTESPDVVAKTADDSGEGGTLTLAVPKIHCEFCVATVKQTLEANDTVDSVELAPQKEEGVIDNKQVIVKFKSGFDVDDAIAQLDKSGYPESSVVE